jgi:hypothetical protein
MSKKQELLDYFEKLAIRGDLQKSDSITISLLENSNDEMIEALWDRVTFKLEELHKSDEPLAKKEDSKEKDIKDFLYAKRRIGVKSNPAHLIRHHFNPSHKEGEHLDELSSATVRAIGHRSGSMAQGKQGGFSGISSGSEKTGQIEHARNPKKHINHIYQTGLAMHEAMGGGGKHPSWQKVHEALGSAHTKLSGVYHGAVKKSIIDRALDMYKSGQLSQTDLEKIKGVDEDFLEAFMEAFDKKASKELINKAELTTEEAIKLVDTRQYELDLILGKVKDKQSVYDHLVANSEISFSKKEILNICTEMAKSGLIKAELVTKIELENPEYVESIWKAVKGAYGKCVEDLTKASDPELEMARHHLAAVNYAKQSSPMNRPIHNITRDKADREMAQRILDAHHSAESKKKASLTKGGNPATKEKKGQWETGGGKNPKSWSRRSEARGYGYPTKDALGERTGLLHDTGRKAKQQIMEARGMKSVPQDVYHSTPKFIEHAKTFPVKKNDAVLDLGPFAKAKVIGIKSKKPITTPNKGGVSERGEIVRRMHAGKGEPGDKRVAVSHAVDSLSGIMQSKTLPFPKLQKALGAKMMRRLRRGVKSKPRRAPPAGGPAGMIKRPKMKRPPRAPKTSSLT